MYLFSGEEVLDSCSFRDEDDDCTYYYTVENHKDPTKYLEVQVLEKKGELQVRLCAMKSHLCMIVVFLTLFILSLQIVHLLVSCGCCLSSCSSCYCWHFCCSAAGNTVPAAVGALRYEHSHLDLQMTDISFTDVCS